MRIRWRRRGSLARGSPPGRAETPAPAKKSLWDRFIQLLPLLQALILAGVGYGLTGSVTNAIQRRQLELNNVKEMQTLLSRLYEPQSSESSASTVAALTAFREYAVPPLTNLLQSSDPNQRTAAESGLRVLALSDSAAVANQLLRVATSRNRLCSWRMLQSSVRLLSDMRCGAAIPAMRDLLGRVSGENRAAALAAITNRDAPPDTTNADDLRAEIQTAIAQLEASP